MAENNEGIKNVIAVCNEFIDSKILFADRKIQKILEAIAENGEVYNLIGECLSVFNRDKEFDKAFTISQTGKGYFALPKDEAKVIALVFCLLVDINAGKINFDELIGRFFLSEEGKKDYHAFMQKVMVPFRNLLAEAFGVSLNVTTVQAIEEMKTNEAAPEEEPSECNCENCLGKAKYSFKDTENLERTFELSRSIAVQIDELLEGERKRTEEIADSKIILNSIVLSCDKKDFEMLISLVLGLKYALKSVKSVRFLTREIYDVVTSQTYCD